MSRFTVVWKTEADGELIRIWSESDDRNQVTRAEADITATLKQDPFGQGQHLSEGLFQIRRDPLAVLFSVDEGDCMVTVLRVKRVG